MAMSVEARSQTVIETLGERLARLRAIDTDVHNDLPSYNELKPFLAKQWHPWLEHGGICWAPSVMWRLDCLYPALKVEVPHLKRLPSEYILSNCYFSTQPIEEPDNHDHLLQMFEMLHAEKTVIFASDYPHWDFDNPLTAFSFFPSHLKRRIFVDNVVDFYGPRVLAPY